MSFHEKSAWVMSLALLLTGGAYYFTVFSMSGEGLVASPNAPLLIGYVVALVLMAIVGHIVIAALAPKEANAAPDERERKIFDRASSISGTVFGAGVVLSLIFYLVSNSGVLLFYSVFLSLILGQLMEYVLQIILFRVALD